MAVLGPNGGKRKCTPHLRKNTQKKNKIYREKEEIKDKIKLCVKTSNHKNKKREGYQTEEIGNVEYPQCN